MKVVLKPLEICCTNIFSIEIFLLLLILYKKSTLSNRSLLAMTEVYLHELCSLQVLAKSCFKFPKVPLDKWFCHWSIHFLLIFTKILLWAITVSHGGHGTSRGSLIWFTFIVEISRKLFSERLAESYFHFGYWRKLF